MNKEIAVLYVEDEDNVREMLAHFISRFCDNIYVAQDGEEGLKVFKEHKIDIVISDIKMPKMNGIEMVEEIKRIKPEQLVIFTTAHIDSDYLFRAIELQVDAYVTKPVDLDKLKSSIDKCIYDIGAKETVLKLQESEEKFRKISQTAQMGIFIYQGTFVYVNDAFCEMTGYTQEALLEMAPWSLIEPIQQEKIKHISLRRLAGEEFSATYSDIKIIRENNEERIHRVSTDTISYKGRYAGLGTTVDITDIVHIKGRLKLLAQAMEQMDEMVRITNAQGKIIYVNEALTKHTLYKKNEILGATNEIFKSKKHTDTFYKEMWKKILQKKTFQTIFINKKKNGELYYEEQTITPILNDDNEIEYYISTSKDVTQRIKMEEQLKILATMDALTNICNRYQINKRIEEEVSRVKRFGGSFALIMFDIDFFKNVNDTYGHDVGDSVLKEFSQIIKENIRETDKFGRWGGEEFMLLCEKIEKEDLLSFANKLRILVEQYSFSKVQKITVSIGASLCQKDDVICIQKNAKEQLIKRVDDALYKAKKEGRNRVVFA